MATTTRKKTTRNTRKTPPKTTKRREENPLTAEIKFIICVGVFIILMLSNFHLGGRVGEWVSSFFFGIFGAVQYFVPVLGIAISGLLISNKCSAISIRKSVSLFILFSMLSTLAQICVDADENLSLGILGYYRYASEHHSGGGLIGGLISYCLVKSVGKIVAVLIVVLVILICIIFITERSLLQGVQILKEEFSMSDVEVEEPVRKKTVRKKTVQNKTKRVREIAQEKPEETKKENTFAQKTNELKNFLLYGKDGSEEKEINSEDSIFPMEEKGDIVEKQDPVFHFHTDLNSDYEQLNFDFDEMMANSLGQKNEQDEETAQIRPENAKRVTTAKKSRKKEETVDNISKEIQEKEKDKKTYVFPPISLLDGGKKRGVKKTEKEQRETAAKLQQTLEDFGVNVTMTDVSCGPAVTRYEMQPETGVKVSKILGLTDDIKLNLAASDIRIEAPIPGKAAIGIEVPNKENVMVKCRDIIESEAFVKFPSKLAFAVGKDISGNPVIADIAKMPHLLIAGATGSGKSVCINTLIISLLYKATPEEVKLIMIDPKVVELSTYNGIPHLLIPVVTDPKKASSALNWAVMEMTDRYKKFAEYSVRNLEGYNQKVDELKKQSKEEIKDLEKMAQIVIIIDELSDLMMVAPGEVEDAIVRLSQLARAAGIHLVIATQRPSVNVITGLIKANVPSRIAFAVSSGVDSRTIIDMNGAEKLLGKGDMLFYPSGYQKPARVQGAMVSDEEVNEVVEFLKAQLKEREQKQENNEILDQIEKSATLAKESQDRDEYFIDAAKFIIEKDKASIGMLQRMFKIGFNRAARIMDQLAQAGIVGPEEGTKPRKVLMSQEELENYIENHNEKERSK